MTHTNLLSDMGFYCAFTAVLLLCSLGLIIFLLLRNKQYKANIEILEHRITKLNQEILKPLKWEAIIPELRKIAQLDHDVNTPLCVITMSMGRAQIIAQQQHDEVLQGNIRDVLDAVDKIGEITEAVRVLKTHPLIANADKRPSVNVGRE